MVLNPQPQGPGAEDSVCAYTVRKSGIHGYILLENVTLAPSGTETSNFAVFTALVTQSEVLGIVFCRLLAASNCQESAVLSEPSGTTPLISPNTHSQTV